DPAALRGRVRLPAASLARPEPLGQRRGGGVAGFPSKVYAAPGRQRPAEPAAELEPLELMPALRPRRRTAVDRDGAFERRTLRGHRSRVVARIRLLLVRGVVLLVHADDAHVAERREDRRPGTDHDGCFTGRDPLAFVTPLGLGQSRVQQRDLAAETSSKPTKRLRRQRDLGYEHDRASPAFERRRAGLEVDLGLAAGGLTIEQEMAAARRR